MSDNAVNIAIEYFRALRSEMDAKIHYQWKMDSVKFTIFMIALGILKTNFAKSGTDSATNEYALSFWLVLIFLCLILDIAIYYRLREIEAMANFIHEELEKKIFKPSIKRSYPDVTLWEDLMEKTRSEVKYYNFKMVRNISTLFSIALTFLVTFFCFGSIESKINIPFLWNYYIGHCLTLIVVFIITCFPLILFMWLRERKHQEYFRQVNKIV